MAPPDRGSAADGGGAGVTTDRTKTIAYFQRTQRWTEQQVIDQVLTPLEEKSLFHPINSRQHRPTIEGR